MESLKAMTSSNQCGIDMLSTALKMEEKGKAFYKKALNDCLNPQCKEIFSALMGEEIIHTSRIKQIHNTLTSSKCWTRDWETIKGSGENLETLFRDLAKKKTGEKNQDQTTDLEAIDMGLDFELASIKFYEEHRTRSTDPLERAFLDQMILEEKNHWKALKDTRYYLTDPEGWFIEKERAGLDGE